MDNIKKLKLTVVGDPMVGKTCLLISYVKKTFPFGQYIPTVFDNYNKKVEINGDIADVSLWDTAGQEDYERLRPLSYPNTDCFLMCYAIDVRSTYENIAQKWYPEIKHFCPSSPILLVATKIDLRNKETNKTLVTTQEGKQLKKQIKAAAFMECSAMERENIDEVFERAIRIALNKKPTKNGKTCIFL